MAVSLHRAWLLAFTLTLLMVWSARVSPAAAQDQADTIEQMRLQIASLKMKLDSAQRRLAAYETDDAQTHATADGSALMQDDAEAQDDARPDKPVSNLVELLERFPRTALPDRAGNWSRNARQEATERLKYDTWARPFMANLTLSNVVVKPNTAARSDASASPHIIVLNFTRETLSYGGQEIIQSVEPIKIFSDRSTARRAERLTAGQPIRVRGQIKTVEQRVFGLEHHSAHFEIHLRKLNLPGLLVE